MRPLRSVLLLAAATGLLSACDDVQLTSPLLDFIAINNTLTADRTASAADTFEVRAFAEARRNDPRLARLQVTVQETYYESATRPGLEDITRTYFDTVFARKPQRFLFVNRFGASTSAGRQRWTYTVTDSTGNTATRSYLLTVRPADSLNPVHTYSVRLQAPRRRSSRATLSALRGFVLPPFATDRADYWALADILYVPTATGPSLASPSSPEAAAAPNLHVRSWSTRRNTALALTTLTPTAFAAATTAAAIDAAVTTAAPVDNAAVSVRKNTVLAFRTAEGNQGLLLVRDVGATAPVDLILDVRIRRQQ